MLNETKDWLKKLEFAFLTDDSKPQLYIHEHYNVRTYQDPDANDTKSSTHFALKIRNEVAQTIMRKIILPRAMLILLSSTRLDDSVFAVECMEGILRWLMDELEDIIKFQTKCLPDKAKKIDSPRVYFLKILPKPSDSTNNTLFKGVRRKFNSTLQNMLEAYPRFGFINVHEITTRQKEQRFFISNNSGLLSDEGVIQLWESISQTFKAIDGKIKPKAITKNQYSQWNPDDFRPKQRNQRSDRNEAYSRNSYNYDTPKYGEHDQRYAPRHSYSNTYYY